MPFLRPLRSKEVWFWILRLNLEWFFWRCRQIVFRLRLILTIFLGRLDNRMFSPLITCFPQLWNYEFRMMSQSHEHVGIKISAKIKIYILSRAKSLCSLCHEIPCNVYLTKKSTETYMTWLLIKYYSIVVSSKLYDKVDSLHLKNSVTSVTFHMLLHFRAVPLEVKSEPEDFSFEQSMLNDSASASSSLT